MHSFRKKLTVAVALGLLLAPLTPALAESHALILSIGNYSNPSANLPGIDLDAANARRIAQSMGVTSSNIRELKDSELSAAGFARAFSDLRDRVRTGDKVFIYYSGHGTQEAVPGTSGCTEGLVAHDMSTVTDTTFTQALRGISAKAGQVVVFNDSCFSGGAFSEIKTLGRSTGANVAKLWKSAPDPNYTCGQAINAKMTRNLSVLKESGGRFVYIAAASDREVAFATSRGSSATQAWLGCLTSSTDGDRSGVLNAGEIQRCAQSQLNGRFNQTISLIGDASLPLSFVDSGPGGVSAASTTPVNPARTLEDIRQGASAQIAVSLSSARNRMRINQDRLALTVNASKSGYLYLLHVGSDGKTFDLLFPNDNDPNNQVGAGVTSLPRAGWAVGASGPAGTSYVMAVLADTPRDFTKGMKKAGTFAQSDATASSAKNLYPESAGGNYGASAVVAIEEF